MRCRIADYTGLLRCKVVLRVKQRGGEDQFLVLSLERHMHEALVYLDHDSPYMMLCTMQLAHGATGGTFLQVSPPNGACASATVMTEGGACEGMTYNVDGARYNKDNAKRLHLHNSTKGWLTRESAAMAESARRLGGGGGALPPGPQAGVWAWTPGGLFPIDDYREESVPVMNLQEGQRIGPVRGYIYRYARYPSYDELDNILCGEDGLPIVAEDDWEPVEEFHRPSLDDCLESLKQDFQVDDDVRVVAAVRCRLPMLRLMGLYNLAAYLRTSFGREIGELPHEALRLLPQYEAKRGVGASPFRDPNAFRRYPTPEAGRGPERQPRPGLDPTRPPSRSVSFTSWGRRGGGRRGRASPSSRRTGRRRSCGLTRTR